MLKRTQAAQILSRSEHVSTVKAYCRGDVLIAEVFAGGGDPPLQHQRRNRSEMMLPRVAKINNQALRTLHRITAEP
jgi:hypothetical protein